MLEDLHIGVPVTGSTGAHLGTLTRIVIERDQPRVTHIVVDPGLIESGNLLAPGGWEKPRERVLPVALVTHADAHGVRLACNEAAFTALPLFEHRDFTAAEVSEPAAGEPRPPWRARFNVGDLVNYVASGWGLGAAPYLGPAEVTYNEPAGASSIAEGSQVWRLDPHEQVGVVERVLADPATQRVTGVVIRRTGLHPHRRILPVGAIAEVADDVVHIRLTDAQVNDLPVYQEES